MQKRLVVLERDPRVPKLMEMADEFQAHKKAVADQQKAVEAKIEVFHDKVCELTDRLSAINIL